MKQFNEMASVLQVGLNRSSLPEATVPLPEVSDEKKALLIAGTLELMVRAGAKSRAGLAPLEEAPEEVARVAARSGPALLEALASGSTAAILEWAEKANRLGFVAPHPALVSLLPLAQKHPELYSVLGERGRWLAKLQGVELKGTEDELLARRKEDPGGYREWLAVELESLDWKERLEAILKLGEGLSMDDEPILQKTLHDKRKEVREASCQLLSVIPDSQVAQTVRRLCESTTSLEKSLLRKSLKIELPLPDLMPKWLPSLGARPNLGERAMALLNIIRFAHPNTLAASVDVTPSEFLQLVAKSEHAEPMIQGLEEGALRFEDQAWIDALFQFTFTRSPIHDLYWDQLAASASDDVFDKVVIGGLDRKEDNSVAWTLTLRKRPLSEKVSTEAFKHLRTDEGAQYILRELGYTLSLSTLSLLQEPYSEATSCEQTRNRLLKTLTLRKRLLESLNP